MTASWRSENCPLFRQLIGHRINGHAPLLSHGSKKDREANASVLHEIMLDQPAGSFCDDDHEHNARNSVMLITKARFAPGVVRREAVSFEH